MTTSRTAAVVAVAAGTCAVALAAAGPVAAANEQDGERASVSVFHGVPGLTVDVYANGQELLPDFKPGTLTAPKPLDPGTYDIKVFTSGADPGGKPAIEKEVDVPAGGNATLVAHLSADGKPELDAFVNDVSSVPAGKSRLTVRHVAAAPAVDVRADGKPVFQDLQNPQEAKAEVAAGTVKADVVLAGTDDVAIGPADLNLKEGTSTIVYAWGSAADKNLALKVQSLGGMHSSPAGVNGGSGDTLAAGVPGTTWIAWGAAGALGAAGVVGTVVARRREAEHRR